MKRFLTLLTVAVLAVVLVACSSDDAKDPNEKSKVLVVGASNNPHAPILERVQPILEKEGIELKIEKYTDFALPNRDLDAGDLDANFFQHIPFYELQLEEYGYDFENAGGVHIEPIGIYSKRHQSLKDLPEGATIMISSSVADHGRMLALLEAQDLIKLKEGVDKTAAELDDIAENPHNFEFDASVSPEMLVQMYENDEADAILINSNFAIDHDINPMEEAIVLEDKDSPYVNIVAVRAEDKDDERIQKLMDALHSKEIQDFIVEEWGGSVVPVDK